MRRWVRLSFTSLFAAVLCFSVYFTAALNAHTASAAYSPSHPNAITALQADLKSHLDLREQAFTLKYKGQTNGLSSQMDKAVHAILGADDSLGYTVSSYRWNTSFTQNEASIKVQVAYWENAKQTAYVVAQTKQIAQQIIKPGMNAHEKVKAVHDWVLLHVAYDTSLVQHSAYAALMGGRTVCQGYALLTYRLLNEAGIPNRIVEGTVSSGLHAWNLVNLDGQWYHLDTTFDDPVPDLRGRTTYYYYLLTDQQMRKDHRWTKVYPAAVTPYANTLTTLKSTDPAKAVFYESLEQSLGYAFLKPENTVKNTDQLAAKIATAIEGGKKAIRVRWTGSSSSLNLQRLLDDVPGLSTVKYTKTPFPHGNPGDVILEVQFK
ncbi:MAG: transglutaminase [Cohnella sp.]|nr:transglutaminase [Cohnella sp.]